MKRLLVCDEIGNAIYSDMGKEADQSGMMCLPFATSQAMLQVRSPVTFWFFLFPF